MKKNIHYIFATILSGAVLLVAPLANAQYSTNNSSDNGALSETESSLESNDKPTDKRPSNERIEALKAAFSNRLTEAEQNRLKGRCKVAQAALATLHTRVNQSVVTRTKAYQKLTDRLNKLVEKLESAEVDTTELKLQISALSTKIETYKTDLANYRQAITDLKAIDCTADPVAFRATLESARTKREALSKTVQDIRAYITETIKPTLQKIRAGLEAKNEEEPAD